VDAEELREHDTSARRREADGEDRGVVYVLVTEDKEAAPPSPLAVKRAFLKHFARWGFTEHNLAVRYDTPAASKLTKGPVAYHLTTSSANHTQATAAELADTLMSLPAEVRPRTHAHTLTLVLEDVGRPDWPSSRSGLCSAKVPLPRRAWQICFRFPLEPGH
jgi:hypothetical protein